MTNTKRTIILLLFVAILASLPTWYTLRQAGDNWRGVPQLFVNDASYYLSRMHEVRDGYALIGNPYYIEHRNEIAPAFFVADWISAFPLLIGISPALALGINFVIWSVITVYLALLLMRELVESERVQNLGVIISFFVGYLFIIRPVVMQIVYPFFILFCLALFRFLKSPEKRSSQWLLIISSAATFYIYSYLWQLTVVILGILFLYHWKRRSPHFRSVLRISLWSALLAMPAIIITFWQTTRPFFNETITRIGLVTTHVPSGPAIKYGVWVVIALIPWLLIYRRHKERTHPLFFITVLLGLLVVSWSNVITGKELETATHIQRFSLIVLSICTASLIEYWPLSNYSRKNKVVIVLCFSLSLINLLPRIVEIKDIFSAPISQTVGLQNHATPLEWLDAQEKDPVVIWADPQINEYIPMLSKHYVLFSPFGHLHLGSNSEMIERYLVANSAHNLTIDEIKTNFRAFAGVGPANDIYHARNRETRLCTLILPHSYEHRCPRSYSDGIEYAGPEYFDSAYKTYTTDIKPNQATYLTKYNVKYILTSRMSDYFQEIPKGFEKVYEDEGFVIYKLSAGE